MNPFSRLYTGTHEWKSTQNNEINLKEPILISKLYVRQFCMSQEEAVQVMIEIRPWMIFLLKLALLNLG